MRIVNPVATRLFRSCIPLLLAAIVTAQTPVSGPIIQTLAGADWSFQADGQPATQAPIGDARGIALDAAGNIYIADPLNFQVYRVRPDGTLSLIAGNGFDAPARSGSDARNSPFNRPKSLAIGPDGSLYVAESFTIVRIKPDGSFSRFAGGGSGGDGGLASAASIQPRNLLCDAAGNLYFSDNNRVRRIGTNGIVTTIAGTGQSGFSGDGAAATSATLNIPSGLRLDTAGNLYIADANNGRIRRVTPGGIISTYLSVTQLNFPSAIDFDAAGNAYVTEQAGHRVVRMTPAGAVSVFAGGSFGFSGDGGPADRAAFNTPTDVVLDRSGNVLVADALNGRVRRISAAQTITTIAGNGLYRFSPEGTQAALTFLRAPTRVAVSPAGLLYLSDDLRRVRRVEADGRLFTVIGGGNTDFDGNGSAQAANTRLRAPDGIVFDSAGNLYVADANRIVRVTPQGTVTQFAGGGNGDPANGGPALNAAIRPTGLAMDAAGNLYFGDLNTHRIIRVTPGGVISVVAGSGTRGFQDGPAANAQFAEPQGIAVDAAGTVFVADTGNQRIRRIAGGIVSTYAGTGVAALPNDGPAAAATFSDPSDLAFDANGALLVMDKFHFRLRRITPAGIVSTVAGDGVVTFKGDGGPATLASLNNPSGVAVDAKGNIYIADLSNFRVRIIPAAAPTISASPAALSFTVRAGDAPPTAQSVAVTGSVVGLPFTISSSATFLTTSASVSATPATVAISVNPGTLAAGSYSGTVTFTSSVAGVAPAIVMVNLTVLAGVPPQLAVDTSGLSFSLVRGGSPATRKIVVSNSGGGSLNFTAVARTNIGGNWLAVAPASGAVTPAAPVSLVITATPGTLAPNTYTGSVTISSGATTVTIPVNMSLSNSGQSIRLGQSGLTFLAVAGAGVTPPQSVAVLNIGQGSFAFTARAIIPAGTPSWLTVSPASGTSDSAQPAPLLTIGANPSGLVAGDYYGRIEVASTGADNSPQTLTVVLRVLPAATDPGPIVQPSGLVFTAVAGLPDPPSQRVSVTNLTNAPVSFNSGLTTLDGGSYVQYIPTNATLAPGSLSLVVRPVLSGLPAGIYRGAITLVFSQGSIQTIGLLIVIAPAGTVITEARAATTGCTPTRLLPLITSLGSNFNVPAAFPTALQVKVVDDCGAPSTSGSVVSSFSNGDLPLSLTSLNDGQWTGTWVNRNTSSRSVSITATAENPPQQLRGSVQTAGGLSGDATPPLIGSGGVVSASSFAAQAPLAPGAFVSIYGARLSNGSSVAQTLPLDTLLAGTTVVIGGQTAPLLFSSDGQVNALLPQSLPVNTRLQMIVTRGNQFSVPEEIQIAPAQPGIFTTASSGRGQGHIYVAQANGTLRLADPANPARAGDTLVIYCSGLGAVDSAVTDGAAAPLDRLVRTVNAVTATIGGVNASVGFGGLAPGFAVGLYQVNVVVPSGVAASDVSPLVLTIAGQASPTVTLAVQ